METITDPKILVDKPPSKATTIKKSKPSFTCQFTTGRKPDGSFDIEYAENLCNKQLEGVDQETIVEHFKYHIRLEPERPRVPEDDAMVL
jgi:hypothetical protein